MIQRAPGRTTANAHRRYRTFANAGKYSPTLEQTVATLVRDLDDVTSGTFSKKRVGYLHKLVAARTDVEELLARQAQWSIAVMLFLSHRYDQTATPVDLCCSDRVV